MIVTCEQCNSRFTLDETLLDKGGSKVQCSNCDHVFTVFPTTWDASDRKDTGDVLQDLVDEKEGGGKVSEALESAQQEGGPQSEGKVPEEDTPFDEADILDLSEISDLPAPDVKDPAGEAADLVADVEAPLQDKQEKTPETGDLELILEEDSDLDGEPEGASPPPDAGKIDFDLSELEEILTPETQTRQDTKAEKAHDDLLKEVPEEPVLEIDSELLGDRTPETPEAATPEKTPEQGEVPHQEETEAGIIDELDLSAFQETAVDEAPPPPEFTLDTEAPSGMEEKEPLAIAPEEKEQGPSGAEREPPEEEGPSPATGSTVAPGLPPEVFSISGKQKRIRTPFLILLVLVLIGGVGYGASFFAARMGISIPFLSDLSIPFISDASKSRVQDPGNLRIRILDVKGRFITSVKGEKRFVITGKVRNDYPEPRTDIQLTGNLVTKARRVVARKTVLCGNWLPEPELLKMELNAIDARLSGRKPGKSPPTRLKPGQTGAFMIVFGNLPGNLDEYSVTVKGSRKMQ